jgi:hypothetical protein
MAERKLTIRVHGKDDGATSMFDRLDDRLKHLKGTVGSRGNLKEIADIMRGGGALAGVAVMGQALGDIADKVEDITQKIREGKASTAELVEETAKSIPVYGRVVEAGRKWRALLDGTAAHIAKMNADAERANRVIDLQQHAAKKAAEAIDNMRQAAEKYRREILLLQSQEPETTFLRIRFAAEDDAKAILDRAKKASDEIAKPIKDLIADLKKQQDAIVVPELIGRGAASFSPHWARENAAAIRDALAQRALIQSQINALEKTRQNQEAQLSDEAAENRRLLRQRVLEQVAAVERRGQQDRERIVREGEQRANDVRAKLREDQLRDMGFAREADLAELERLHKDRLEAIDRAAAAELEKHRHLAAEIARIRDEQRAAEIHRHGAEQRKVVDQHRRGDFERQESLLGRRADIGHELVRSEIEALRAGGKASAVEARRLEILNEFLERKERLQQILRDEAASEAQKLVAQQQLNALREQEQRALETTLQTPNIVARGTSTAALDEQRFLTGVGPRQASDRLAQEQTRAQQEMKKELQESVRLLRQILMEIRFGSATSGIPITPGL